jgi:hypothetical protein
MPDFDELVVDPQMRRELGGISDMTTWRWDHDIARAPDGWELPIRIGSRRKYRTRGMNERVKAALLKVPNTIQRPGRPDFRRPDEDIYGRKGR